MGAPRLLTLLLATMLQLPQPARAEPVKTVPAKTVQAELRGVWLTANDMPVLRDRTRMQATLDQLADLRFNRLYAVVWNGGMAYYPSQVSEGRQFQNFTYRGLQGQDVIGELIAAGRSRGLMVLRTTDLPRRCSQRSQIRRKPTLLMTIAYRAILTFKGSFTVLE